MIVMVFCAMLGTHYIIIKLNINIIIIIIWLNAI